MIETQRLLLKSISEQDLEIYQELLGCPVTTKYLPGGKPFERDYIKNYVCLKVEHWRKGFGTFIITLKDSPGTKVGYAGVEEIPDTSFNDIRYALLPEFHGKGYALEAAEAVLDFTFNLNLFNEVYGVAVIENTASVNLLKKIGMRKRTDIRLYENDNLVTMSISKNDVNCH